MKERRHARKRLGVKIKGGQVRESFFTPHPLPPPFSLLIFSYFPTIQMNTLGSLRETRAASLSKKDFLTVVVNSTARILEDDANLYYPFSLNGSQESRLLCQQFLQCRIKTQEPYSHQYESRNYASVL